MGSKVDIKVPSRRQEHENVARRASQKERRIGHDFTLQVGRLVILWGDMEALARTLELMKVGGLLRYRAKTDEELQRDYRAKRRPFDKRLKAVLPHQTAMARGILALKDVRDFCLHGAVIKWGDGAGRGRRHRPRGSSGDDFRTRGLPVGAA